MVITTPLIVTVPPAVEPGGAGQFPVTVALWTKPVMVKPLEPGARLGNAGPAGGKAVINGGTGTAPPGPGPPAAWGPPAAISTRNAAAVVSVTAVRPARI